MTSSALHASVSQPAPTTRGPESAPGSRTIRIGLLGLGNVGQAVVRATQHWSDRWRPRGFELEVTAALVRDPNKPRHARPRAVTSEIDRFLAHDFDIVVEALGGVEPARTLVRRCLARGIPVVTANKSLLAAAGPELRRLAAQAGTTLRVEASALAGVPLVGTLAARPVIADLVRLCGILNGTTNYILTRMRDAGEALETVLADAQARGYAEPDPTSDVTGIDAVEKLTLLLGTFGIAEINSRAIERTSITEVDRALLLAAARLGGVLKPIVAAEVRADTVPAFCGPTFVPHEHPLARVDGVENAIVVDNPRVGRLTFAGPGAGPDVTAATIVDDVCEIVAERPIRTVHPRTAPAVPARPVAAPATPWLVRLAFADGPPERDHLLEVLHDHGVWITRSARIDTTSLAILTGACDRKCLAAALDAVRDAAPCTCQALRALEVEA